LICGWFFFIIRDIVYNLIQSYIQKIVDNLPLASRKEIYNSAKLSIEKVFENSFGKLRSVVDNNSFCDYYWYKTYSDYFEKKKGILLNCIRALLNKYSHSVTKRKALMSIKTHPPTSNVNSLSKTRSRPRPSSDTNAKDISTMKLFQEESEISISSKEKDSISDVLSSIHPTLLPYHAIDYPLPPNWVPQMDKHGFHIFFNHIFIF
jgi:hypothetical protein